MPKKGKMQGKPALASAAADDIAIVEQKMEDVSLNESSSSAAQGAQSSTSASAVSNLTIDRDGFEILVDQSIACLENLMQTHDENALQFTFIEDAANCVEQCPSLSRFWSQCQDLNVLLNGGDISQSSNFMTLVKVAYSVRDLSSLVLQFSPLFATFNACETTTIENCVRSLVSWSIELNPPVVSTSEHNSLTLWQACMSLPTCRSMFSKIRTAIQSLQPAVGILPLNDDFGKCMNKLYAAGLIANQCILFGVEQALGIANSGTMEFVGRGSTVDEVVKKIERNLSSAHRCDTIFVNGCAGVGKTRALVQICQNPMLGNVIQFFVTFNHETGLTDLDQVLFSDLCTSPAALSLRLLYSYAFPKTDSTTNFGDWCARLVNCLKNDRIPITFLQSLAPICVIRWLQNFVQPHQKKDVLVVVDECLMAWNVYENSIDSIKDNTWAMLRSLYTQQGFNKHFSVLFCALNNRPFQKNQEPSPTKSKISHFDLGPLTIDEALRMLRKCFENPKFAPLIQSFHMTLDKFVTRIIQICGTVPRALEFFITAAESKHVLDFRELAAIVSHMIAEKYPLITDFTDRRLAEALLGIPIDYDTAFSLLKKGVCVDAVPLDSHAVHNASHTPIQVKLEMIHVIAYSLNLTRSNRVSKNTDPQIALFHSVLNETFQAISSAFSAHDTFEEIYRYRLFLELHYRRMFRRKQRFDMCRYFSPSVASFDINRVQLLVNTEVPVNRRQVSCWNPISAASIQNNHDKFHVLTVPSNHYEPGVDTIAYVRVPGAVDLPSMIFGIQLKFRFAMDRQVNMDNIKSSAHTFFCRMLHLGHKMENLVFVAVLHQSLPQYMFEGGSGSHQRASFFCGLGRVILVCDNAGHFEKHLGPTLSSLTSQFYNTSRSDNYEPVANIFPDHNDASSLFSEPHFKTYQAPKSVQLAALVLALELENFSASAIYTRAIQLLRNWPLGPLGTQAGCTFALQAFNLLKTLAFPTNLEKFLNKLEVALKKL